jgi:hypothetical protein
MTSAGFRRHARARLLALPWLLLAACGHDAAPIATDAPHFTATGAIRSAALDEISGIQAGPGTQWYVHNDDGKAEIHVIDLQGNHLAAIELRGASNRDWEDITAIPGTDGTTLVIGDIGDNHRQRKSLRLYMAAIPPAPEGPTGAPPRSIALLHSVKLHYPDGRRDCEAMAYDPASDQILLMSKRDVPPRLYGVAAGQALQADELTMTFLGTVAGLRPPDPTDLLKEPRRGAWVSQPTGMDISGDGQFAAVITYRSLYLYRRAQGESWPQALQKQPLEIHGPPGRQEEAVAFSHDQSSVVVTGENLPATIYRLDLAYCPASHCMATPPQTCQRVLKQAGAGSTRPETTTLRWCE